MQSRQCFVDEEQKSDYYINMKQISILLLLTIFLAFSCATSTVQEAPPEPVITVQPSEPPPPAPPPEPQPVITPEPAPSPPEQPVFNPKSITEEKFEATKTDVRDFINNLNRIIKAKNYNAWRGFLADSYLGEISSKEFLEERTEELYRRDQIVASNMGRDPKRVQKKILRTPKDYFDNVVVPSRSNDRMDDIDFVSENRVKAYTIDTRGTRLVLYDLEYIDNKWKIVN